MIKIEEVKLSDILIDGPVTELLADKVRISRRTQMTKPQAMLEGKKDQSRRRATKQVIREVRSEMTTYVAYRGVSRDHVASLMRKEPYEDD